MIGATMICHSISEQEKELPTWKLRYPKFIHGEVKTHRVFSSGNEGGYFVLEQECGFMADQNFSRNASSSRAIPVSKMIAEVRDENEMAWPVYFGKEQKGMQAGEAFVGQELKMIMQMWRDAALSAADHAERLARAGLHKSLVNRVIEPYTHINVLITATEFDNFFGLRLHKDAQPEARALAIAMWEARKASIPQDLKPEEWHLPFADDVCFDDPRYEDRLAKAIRVSVARCARVSYESFETGKRSTVEEDLKLYDRLVGMQPLHASPAEHQATPDTGFQQVRPPYLWFYHNQLQHGNFVGWRQYRKMLPGEAVAPIPEEFRS